jgi:hypothetical protein
VRHLPDEGLAPSERMSAGEEYERGQRSLAGRADLFDRHAVDGPRDDIGPLAEFESRPVEDRELEDTRQEDERMPMSA